MTPDDYFERIGSLVETGRFEEALALAEAQGRYVTPELRPEQFFDLCSLLEFAQRAVDYSEAHQPVSFIPTGFHLRSVIDRRDC